MRWSNAFFPTLRDDPADAEAVSHRLLIRAGYVRQLMAGAYSLLPLAQRVRQKIIGVVRKEMNAIGAQEFVLPALHPAEIWQRSGRWEVMGDEMFRLKDRRGADLSLGMTHEEIFTDIARELRTYKYLPQIWYQFQTKFRDEPRPKSGILRVREFTMKDSYSFDLDPIGLDRAFHQHFEAYRKIFSRMGLETLAVEASSGSMGGAESIEFMIASDAGEDFVVSCAKCGYAANLEKATSNLPTIDDGARGAAIEKFATPGIKTIEALGKFAPDAPAERQIKTLVYCVDEKLVLVLLRGDHTLCEQKLKDGFGAIQLRPAHDEEIRALLGALPGSLGAVGVVAGQTIVADTALQGRHNMVTGANEDGFHLRGVDVARDLPSVQWSDLREVKAGEACPQCGSELSVAKTIEVGHIFKLGTRYSEALGASVLDAEGNNVPIVMGSYGIGVERLIAAVVEQSHDANGIIWPVTVAPFEVVVSVINPKEVQVAEAGTRVYEALLAHGVDVLLDDRDERPGVKFKDADLIGFPYRITIGPKGLQQNQVELVRRRDAEKRNIALEHVADVVAELIAEERR